MITADDIDEDGNIVARHKLQEHEEEELENQPD